MARCPGSRRITEPAAACSPLPITMRAAVYSAFGGPITVQELPKPEAPPGGVLIEVKATGVCRSDWHGWKGHDSDIADHGLPFVPGHELSGIVAQLGEGVSGFAVGDRVAVPFILSCGCCRECARGRPTICEDQEQPGFTRFGSFAEFVALPRADRNLARLPAEVSFEAAAALGCRGTTAYRAVVQQGRLAEGESVAVFGCGGLGLSCVMMAKAHGAAHIVAVDTSGAARDKAIELGATAAVDASLGSEHVRAQVSPGVSTSTSPPCQQQLEQPTITRAADRSSTAAATRRRLRARSPGRYPHVYAPDRCCS